MFIFPLVGWLMILGQYWFKLLSFVSHFCPGATPKPQDCLLRSKSEHSFLILVLSRMGIAENPPVFHTSGCSQKSWALDDDESDPYTLKNCRCHSPNGLVVIHVTSASTCINLRSTALFACRWENSNYGGGWLNYEIGNNGCDDLTTYNSGSWNKKLSSGGDGSAVNDEDGLCRLLWAWLKIMNPWGPNLWSNGTYLPTYPPTQPPNIHTFLHTRAHIKISNKPINNHHS